MGRFLWAWLTLAFAGCAGTGRRATPSLTIPAGRPPNIIVIMADDQGYQDLGCYGSPDISTPNLDQMAVEGMRFTDFYAAAAVCTPSRIALLTGCYAPRVSLSKVLFPFHEIGINDDEVTIAELLKRSGYATACVGKWHLGHHPPFLPTRHGFDHYFGLPYSNDMQPITNDKARERGDPLLPLMEDEQVIERGVDQSLLTRRYTFKAVEFIEQYQDEPFFLYLPHSMPHIPIYASDWFRGTSPRGLYGDVIREIDWSCGVILETLRRLDLERDTLVVYTSDNGPWRRNQQGGSAKPLRGGKSSTWEGGMRVPCIMRWPGTIPAGATCSSVASSIDFLPTFAMIAGAVPPDDRVIDGMNISALMAGGSTPELDNRCFFYFRGENLQGVRQGPYKLRVVRPADTDEVRTMLYDLREDISERRNVMADHPEVMQRLLGRRRQLDRSIKEERRPSGEL